MLFYDVAGPLFFGAAQKALAALTTITGDVHTVIIDLEDVPAVEATGLVALESIIEDLNDLGIKVVLTGVQVQPKKAFARAGMVDVTGKLEITDNVGDTITQAILGAKRDG
ncbi:MAG: sodium-independent anion transporter [Acidimicrobiia bacterium]